MGAAYLEILLPSSSFSSPSMASMHLLPPPRRIVFSELHTESARTPRSGSRQSKASSVGRCVEDIPCDCRYDRRIDDVSEGSSGEGCFTLIWEVHKNCLIKCIPGGKIDLQGGASTCSAGDGMIL